MDTIKNSGLTAQHRRRVSQIRDEGSPCREMLKQEFGIDVDEFQDQVAGGKGDLAEPSDFEVDQIKQGVEVEMEHTDDPYIALEIVLDHLTEADDYYTRLTKMESEAKKSARWRK